jgi:hypothetical protein
MSNILMFENISRNLDRDNSSHNISSLMMFSLVAEYILAGAANPKIDFP